MLRYSFGMHRFFEKINFDFNFFDFNFLDFFLGKNNLKIKFVDINAKKPIKTTKRSVGYELCTYQEFVLEPGTRKLVSTGIIVEIPTHFYLRIAPLNELSSVGLDICNYNVSSSEELKVCVVNNSTNTMHFDKGAKIAEMIVERSKNNLINIMYDF